jgi:predicted metalloendopeptidase
MNLYDVNSGYMPTYNSMMIMPTMIMPPLMPNDVNEAIVYATAAGIGHEMTHGFDSFGTLYDKNGEKNAIFVGQADLDKFKQISQQLADCYSTLEVIPDKLPGVFNNGNFTLGENIADLGGTGDCLRSLYQSPEASGLRGRRTATPAATFLSCLRSSVAGPIHCPLCPGAHVRQK